MNSCSSQFLLIQSDERVSCVAVPIDLQPRKPNCLRESGYQIGIPEVADHDAERPRIGSERAICWRKKRRINHRGKQKKGATELLLVGGTERFRNGKADGRLPHELLHQTIGDTLCVNVLVIHDVENQRRPREVTRCESGICFIRIERYAKDLCHVRSSKNLLNSASRGGAGGSLMSDLKSRESEIVPFKE